MASAGSNALLSAGLGGTHGISRARSGLRALVGPFRAGAFSRGVARASLQADSAGKNLRPVAYYRKQGTLDAAWQQPLPSQLEPHSR
jgi:NAD(P)H-dependent FMN reductase